LILVYLFQGVPKHALFLVMRCPNGIAYGIIRKHFCCFSGQHRDIDFFYITLYTKFIAGFGKYAAIFVVNSKPAKQSKRVALQTRSS